MSPKFDEHESDVYWRPVSHLPLTTVHHVHADTPPPTFARSQSKPLPFASPSVATIFEGKGIESPDDVMRESLSGESVVTSASGTSHSKASSVEANASDCRSTSADVYVAVCQLHPARPLLYSMAHA